MFLRRTLRVLIWREQSTQSWWSWVEDLRGLRICLHDRTDDICSIELLAPETDRALICQAEALNLQIKPVPRAPLADESAGGIDEFFLRQVIATAQSQDCDFIVVPDDLLPLLQPADEQPRIKLLNPSSLLRKVEIFVRGFGVPWSFGDPTFGQPFNIFYPSSETEAFRPGQQLLDLLKLAKQDPTVIETSQKLTYNRTIHLCYSRDMLLFYLLQRDLASELNSTGQPFTEELAYHLNFYYLLLYGAFDHAARLVNGICCLNLREQDAHATYSKFLEPLKAASPALHDLFTETATKEFLVQLGALRHQAAHGGPITPCKLVAKPDKEPTDDEIDTYINESGQDDWLFDLPDGPRRTELQVALRSIIKMEMLERNPIDSDVVFPDFDKDIRMHPLSDVDQNFRRTLGFLHRVYAECSAHLAKSAGTDQSPASGH